MANEQLAMGNLAAAGNLNVDIEGTEGKYLTFFTDRQLFGTPIDTVVQIVGVQQITPIPEFPSYAKGIINLRGQIIPVIDIRLRFCKEEVAYDERTCIIVTDIDGTYVGFIVDGVDEVTDIDDDQISETPRMKDGRESEFVTGIGKVGKKIILLLNPRKILNMDELHALSSNV